MEAAGRLIGENDPGLRDDGPRHGDLLLLPSRQLRRIEILLSDDLELVEDLGNPRLTLLARHVPVGQRDIEVLVNGQVVDQVKLLEHEADVRLVQRVALLDAHRVHGLVVEEILARVFGVEHAENRKQGGLSRPRRTHDRDEFAFVDVEIDLAQNERLPALVGIGLFDITQANHTAHSSLRASIGSTCAARSAGTSAAMLATASISATTPTSVNGSVGETPKS